MKRTLAIFLALVLLLSTMVVYARSPITSEEMEGLTFIEVLIEAETRGFYRNITSVSSSDGSSYSRNIFPRALIQETVAHFMPHYAQGVVVDTNLIGEDGRPIEGYSFAQIQNMQTEGVTFADGTPNRFIVDEWLYAYKGMTTLEMAIFNRVNEVRAEHDLQPLVHDPLASVGARIYRDRYHNLPSQYIWFLFKQAPNRTIASNVVFDSDLYSYDDIAYNFVNSLLASPANRDRILGGSSRPGFIGIGAASSRSDNNILRISLFFGWDFQVR